MKITYLGTAASEGLPAPFCTCPVCQKARQEGGKSVRTRTQALVDESLLIDFPPDTYLHWLRNNFDFLKVTDLLVTHSHMDHWYPDDLRPRWSPSATTTPPTPSPFTATRRCAASWRRAWGRRNPRSWTR